MEIYTKNALNGAEEKKQKEFTKSEGKAKPNKQKFKLINKIK